MHLTQKQRGVAVGMVAGLVLSFIVVCYGSGVFINFDVQTRFAISFLLPAIALFVAIARLAQHRFFNPADIDGSALSTGSDQARLLQAQLQNTLEQLALASPVYIVALFGSHQNVQSAVPACACTFLLGRILFFATYKRGASARAFGFAITFYPTVLLLGWQLWLVFV